MAAGDNFTIDCVPGTGTVITVKGQPADWKRKDGLLGTDKAG